MPNRALFWAVNDYPWWANDLRGCVNDQRDWRQELLARNFTVETLTDAKAKHARIMALAETLLSGLRGGDHFVLGNSSHGSYATDTGGDEPDRRDELLIAYDMDNPIWDDEIWELFARHPLPTKWLITDCCHSGSADRFIGTALTDRPRYLPIERIIANAGPLKPRAEYALGSVREPNCIHLSACADTETAADAIIDGRPCGAFSHFALAALKKYPQGATAEEWYEDIRRRLPSRAYPQAPLLTVPAGMAGTRFPGRV